MKPRPYMETHPSEINGWIADTKCHQVIFRDGNKANTLEQTRNYYKKPMDTKRLSPKSFSV